jgi:RNA polymerase subunit RPABC4/transcription elongation factor Spt4
MSKGISAMMEEERRHIYLSCFKCGRIVKSTDAECPRCGLKFGPGTLFECPFCCGLIWRNATTCSTCGIDLTKFSESVEKSSAGFDMDEFVDSIITSELKSMKATIRRVACPGCGLMIRGDEDKCPRCDLPLEKAQVDCPLCGEKVPISATSCSNCGAVFEEVCEIASESPSKEQERIIEEVAKEAKGKKRLPGRKKSAKKAPSEKKPGRKGRAKKDK